MRLAAALCSAMGCDGVILPAFTFTCWPFRWQVSQPPNTCTLERAVQSNQPNTLLLHRCERTCCCTAVNAQVLALALSGWSVYLSLGGLHARGHRGDGRESSHAAALALAGAARRPTQPEQGRTQRPSASLLSH